MIVRPANSDDLPTIRAIYAPYVLETAITFEEDVPDLTTLAERMEAAHLYLVAEDNGAVVGYAYAGEHRSRYAYRFSCDLSVYVSQDHSGRGVGHALYDALLPGLAAKAFHTAYGGLNLPNDPSIALHERFGFHHIGTFTEVGFKFGRWRDVGWWEKRLSPNG